ncbi:MAG: hypothetical protein H7A35_03495 [Planctomycetales bacterium]|nr:hypothetical protein [bacterium]UNM09119.1 MAG: hypothetical protein H7A35_03495 [Planctomycetales bacterium]
MGRMNGLQTAGLLATSCIVLAACGGGQLQAGSADYPDGKGMRTLPAAPPAQQLDWMVQRFSDANGNEYAVNFSEAVLALDIARPDSHQKKLDGLLTTLYPDMRSAVNAAQGSGTELLPSVDMIDVYQKYTDDRVLAALELEVSRGDIVYPGGKQQWLADLYTALPAGEDADAMRARAFVATAFNLGGGSLQLDPKLAALSARMKQQFERDRIASTVIGFYSQSDSLSAIFRRDRFLQGVAGAGRPGWFDAPDDAGQLALMQQIDNALSGSMALRDAYNDFNALQAIVTNPAAPGDLNDLAAPTPAGIAVFPHSRSLEEQLFTGAPPGSQPMELLKDALLSGEVDLQPQPDSGWYAHQQYALETLLLPERAEEFAKLDIAPAYLSRLETAFESTITQRRETQSKNLAAGELASAPMMQDVPVLRLEPAPTVYLRTARAYRFLYGRLSELPAAQAGNEQLDWLLAEVSAAARRYLALHLLSCADIGHASGCDAAELEVIEGLATDSISADELELCMLAGDPRFSPAQQLAIAALADEAQDWLAFARANDQQHAAFMSYDPRVCVPAAQFSGQALNWGVIGVRLLLLETDFSTLPKVVGGDLRYQQMVDSRYGRSQRFLLPVYEYAAFNTAEPISREQFRQWCDQSRSKEEFMLVAQAYGGVVGKSWLEQWGMWIIILICVGLFRDKLFPGIFGPKKDEPADGDKPSGDAPAAG